MKVLLDILVKRVMGIALFCLILRAVAGETVEKRIVFGSMEEKNRPFFVFLNIYVDTMENPRNCGGVFIDRDIVLSAAKCFRPYENLKAVIAQVGDFRRTNFIKGRKKQIEAVSVEVYDEMIEFVEKPGVKQQPPDIARVKLASKVAKKKDLLKPCDADFWDTPLIGKLLVTVGMGKLYNQKSNFFPVVLQKLDIKVTEENGKCGKVKTNKVYDSIDKFCAGGLRNFIQVQNQETIDPEGICEGDEGGPVFFTSVNDKSVSVDCLVGVLNGGIHTLDNSNTCEDGILFTSVRNLSNWVKNHRLKQISFSEKEKKPSLFSKIAKLLPISKKKAGLQQAKEIFDKSPN